MFGQLLRTMRQDRGLTQRELGALVGVTHARISVLEGRPTPPTLPVVEQLARALDCQVTKLLNLPSDSILETRVADLTKELNSCREEIGSLVSERDGLLELLDLQGGEDGRLIVWLRVLGITPDDLTSKYRQAAKSVHPDAGGSHEAFLRLKEAYDQLRQRI